MIRLFLWSILGLVAWLSAKDTPPSRWTLAFEGEQAFSESQLESQLDLPEEFAVLKPERRDFMMKLAKGNVEIFYLSNGYFSSKINLVIQQRSYADTLIQNYTLKISEGTRYHFRNALLKLAPDARTLLDESSLLTARGKYYDPTDISDDLQSIRSQYRHNGYLHVKVDHVEWIDTVDKVVDVEFNVDPGAQVKMGRFRSLATRSARGQDSANMAGLSDTSWLSGMWELEEGQVIDGTYYSDFRSKLFSTQLFSQVRLEDTLRTDGSGLSDITLTVMERIPGETRYGAFFEETYGFGVSTYSRHRNLFGAFNEGSFSAMVAQNRQEVILGYANPLLFGTAIAIIPTAIRFDDRIFLDHEKLPAPSNADSLVERWKIENRGDLTFGLAPNIRARNTYDLSYVRKQDDNLLTLKSEIGLDFDFTDNSYDPTLGLRVAPTLGVGGKVEGNTVTGIGVGNTYAYTDISSSFYFPLYGPLFGALGASYGRIFDRATEDDAQVFYQGGGRSVRGYRFRSIYPSKVIPSTKPTDESTILTGLSPQYYRINQELRLNGPWKPIRNFQLVQFIDWTQVQDSDPTFESTECMAFGMGLRYKWQFLTIRLDYTLQKEFQNLAPEPFSVSRISFDLSQAI